MSQLSRFLGALALSVCATLASAQDAVLKPFVLGSKSGGDLTQKVEATTDAQKEGFFSDLFDF